jgi:hypothetical protein
MAIFPGNFWDWMTVIGAFGMNVGEKLGFFLKSGCLERMNGLWYGFEA